MAINKWTLDMGAMQEDFFDGTAMIGIVSAMQGYRLCWVLNNHFDTSFIRDPEQNISFQKKETEFFFPVYRHDFANSSHKYQLYKLKNGNETLLPEAKQLDYLWLVQTANPEDDAYHIARELRNVPEVQLSRILDIGALKNIKNLIV
jgi:hypothetical protein